MKFNIFHIVGPNAMKQSPYIRLLAENFPTVPRMQPGDVRSRRSQHNKQTNNLTQWILVQRR